MLVKSPRDNTGAPERPTFGEPQNTSEEVAVRDDSKIPEDMDALIDEVQAEHPSLAYMGPVETDPREWSEDELDAMGTAFLTGLVQMRI
jgi:hypothetical protein